ncbi:Gdp-D-Glucose Phosphorylase 1 [Manis pentadactyla]|nr:Gdp-D-Glucose Phosphorylase 1 [Manis pentadactyla]
MRKSKHLFNAEWKQQQKDTEASCRCLMEGSLGGGNENITEVETCLYTRDVLFLTKIDTSWSQPSCPASDSGLLIPDVLPQGPADPGACWPWINSYIISTFLPEREVVYAMRSTHG